MKEMIWSSDCARGTYTRYSGAAFAVSVSFTGKMRVLNLRISSETCTRAALNIGDSVDVGIDPEGQRIAIRASEAGTSRICSKTKNGLRHVSLKLRAEWHIVPETTLHNDVCALEVTKPGYIQARLPHSWSNAFVK